MRKLASIVLATRNEHKIREIKTILGNDVDYLAIGDYLTIKVKEAGRTLVANSLAKAAFAFKATGKPSLADDSGLFVDALDGEPGIYSSRYGKNDTERIRKLLKAARAPESHDSRSASPLARRRFRQKALYRKLR